MPSPLTQCSAPIPSQHQPCSASGCVGPADTCPAQPPRPLDRPSPALQPPANPLFVPAPTSPPTTSIMGTRHPPCTTEHRCPPHPAWHHWCRSPHRPCSPAPKPSHHRPPLYSPLPQGNHQRHPSHEHPVPPAPRPSAELGSPVGPRACSAPKPALTHAILLLLGGQPRSHGRLCRGNQGPAWGGCWFLLPRSPGHVYLTGLCKPPLPQHAAGRCKDPPDRPVPPDMLGLVWWGQSPWDPATLPNQGPGLGWATGPATGCGGAAGPG